MFLVPGSVSVAQLQPPPGPHALHHPTATPVAHAIALGFAGADGGAHITPTLKIGLLDTSSGSWCYQLGNGVLLTRRQGRKQWTNSGLKGELAAQLRHDRAMSRPQEMRSAGMGPCFGILWG